MRFFLPIFFPAMDNLEWLKNGSGTGILVIGIDPKAE
jgi:hypothetical protein